MGTDDWYRNTTWDADIEAAFEAKLARTRSQKAQYLRIQGSMLKDSRPDVAVRLLDRCIAEGEPFHIAHAMLDKGHALYVAGEVDAALQSLEEAIDQQRREPMFRTSAAFDFAFLVALHEREERYDRALKLLDQGGDPIFADMAFEAESARAVISASRGDMPSAREAAHKALAAREDRSGWIPGHPEVGVVPHVDDPLTQRLRAIASGEA